MPPEPTITPLIEKMSRRDVISTAERQTLSRLLGPVRTVPAGKAIVEPGDRPSFSTFVVNGFCARFSLTPGGGRQLTEINLAGDFVDLHSLLMRQMDHGVVALAECVIAPAAHEDLRRLTETQPHLTRLLWLETVVDAAIHRQWLVTMGQQDAASRLAHLFCELYLRSEAAGLASHHGFALPMTQTDLGDVLGLTQVHVNRVLMELRRQGLVDWKTGQVVIHDWDALARLGAFDPAYLRLQRDAVNDTSNDDAPAVAEHKRRLGLSDRGQVGARAAGLSRTAGLAALLATLEARGYDFVTPTPSVCRRAAERRLSQGAPLRAIFGWSQAFVEHDLDPSLLNLLRAADLVTRQDDRLRCKVRVSRLSGLLFLHSAFPATGQDAVFLGPDSYRFARLIGQAAGRGTITSIAEIGCGAGVGGLVAAKLHPRARLDLGDVNVAALDLAAANAAHAGVIANVRKSDGMAALQGPYDLIVANPPYVAGASGRTYKDGGEMHGARLSLDWTGQALERLNLNGRLVLYTGSAILDGGTDALRTALEGLVAGRPFRLAYEELDPDIFAGELRRAAYDDVERIAAVAAVITRIG